MDYLQTNDDCCKRLSPAALSWRLSVVRLTEHHAVISYFVDKLNMSLVLLHGVV